MEKNFDNPHYPHESPIARKIMTKLAQGARPVTSASSGNYDNMHSVYVYEIGDAFVVFEHVQHLINKLNRTTIRYPQSLEEIVEKLLQTND